MKHKMYLFVAFVAMMMASCSTMTRCEKLAHQGWEAKKIRGYGMAESKNRNAARSRAMLNATNEIAATMNAFVQSYELEYNEDYKLGESTTNAQMSATLKERAVSEYVKGASVIYTTTKEKKDGNFVYEVCMELDQKTLEKAMKKAGVKNVDAVRIQNTWNKMTPAQPKKRWFGRK